MENKPIWPLLVRALVVFGAMLITLGYAMWIQHQNNPKPQRFDDPEPETEVGRPLEEAGEDGSDVS